MANQPAPAQDEREIYITSFTAKERPRIAAHVYLERNYAGGPDTLFYRLSRAYKPGRSAKQIRQTDKMYCGTAKYLKEVVELAESFVRRHVHDPESAIAAGHKRQASPLQNHKHAA